MPERKKLKERRRKLEVKSNQDNEDMRTRFMPKGLRLSYQVELSEASALWHIES